MNIKTERGSVRRLLSTLRNTDLSASCLPGVCQHGGVCHDSFNTFYCDCNMTAYSGPKCTEGRFRFNYDLIMVMHSVATVCLSVCL